MSEANYQVISALKEVLGSQVLTDEATRQQCANDRSHHRGEPPLAVVRPQSTEDISAAMRVCSIYSTPVVPRGSGTGLEGGANTTADSICLDLSKMTAVIEIAADDLYAKVQPGVMKSQLNRALEPHGLWFPVGPGVDASLGGMASTNASGTTAVSYGTLTQNVLGLTAVLADGSVITTGASTRKTSAGYDLTHLLVGSEGTLAIIAELTITVHPIPREATASVWGLPDLQAASSLVVAALKSSMRLTRIELLDTVTVGAIGRYSGYELPQDDTLMVEFSGSAQEAEDQRRQFAALAATFGASEARAVHDPAEREQLWQARADALPASAALIPGSTHWSTDVCVPITKLPQCIAETKEDLNRHNILAPIVGHVGDGNFHLAIILPPHDEDAFAEAIGLNDRLVDRALSMGGTCTGEHGVGSGKLASVAKEHGPALEIMQRTKAAWDPQNILNPGKVVPPPQVAA